MATTAGDTVHDDERGWPPASRRHVTVDLGRLTVAVTGPGGERRRVSVTEHREDVVRRLLHRGLTPRCLTALLPEFRTLIDAQTGS